eukprot:CAMPEP_0173384234 /NCGR_PEP_ID=MMETSP1356-20130122/6802_1 /TAXON_ID=77927 ORGANISM="Hemiselmis virescens, Strain PCC157" /NCGR_SAMPLE_ID=MMETSP1356 /ASSEMBLY_ACC=CAM_ASM_000847 /LENGTH=73 /DNA_ID=CAMNT_0014339475 /DNA_START=101 /DNA_END=319 /DNA_ORIENTATION=+
MRVGCYLDPAQPHPKLVSLVKVLPLSLAEASLSGTKGAEDKSPASLIFGQSTTIVTGPGCVSGTKGAEDKSPA